VGLVAWELAGVTLHDLFQQAPSPICILTGPDHVVAMANTRFLQGIGSRPVIGRPIGEVLSELQGMGFSALLDRVYATGIPYTGEEVRMALARGPGGAVEEACFNLMCQPMRSPEDAIDAILVFAVDVTEQVQFRRRIETMAAELRVLARQQEAVAAMGQRLIAGGDLPEILTDAVRTVTEVLQTEFCAVLELMPGGESLVVRQSKGWSNRMVGPTRLPSGLLTQAGYTLQADGPVICPDLRAETRFQPPAEVAAAGAVSGISVVIGGQEMPYGVLSTHSYKARAFSADDARFLQAVAHTVAAAVEQTRDRRRLATQHAVATVLATTDDADDAMPQVLEAICRGMEWDLGFLWLADQESNALRCAGVWQAEGFEEADAMVHRVDDLALAPGEGLPGAVWQAGAPLWVDDVLEYPCFVRKPEAAVAGLHTAFLFPILLGDEVHGVIEYFSRERWQPDQAMLRTAVAIGTQIGQYLQRHRAETELRQFNADLEQRVAARTAELEAANQELEAFAYSVSHDLRAPLRTINGFSQAIDEDYGHLLGEDGVDSLRRIRDAARRMGVLIDDLLRLSRVVRSELRREVVDLSRMAEAVVADFQKGAPDRQVAVSIAGGLAAVADERLIRVVLENLLANAWKFTGRTPGARVEFGAVWLNGQRVYFVRDNGAGFDMAYAGKLFVPFQRLHKATEFEGTGIGLATVHRIIQRHGGRVWATAAVGQGATFFFTL
jgi:signal transduction histidine kinase